MGMVFQAKDSTLERLVALKVMKPDNSSNEVSRKRFLQEARAAASIQHDHIVTIYQVGEDNGLPYLAMQFLRGESLDSRLRRESPLPVAEIVRIGREMAEGLAAAHARGMIHRDIKPANIWLEDLGPENAARVKILDFGLARVSTEQSQHLTRPGVVMGTPGYMAPEQARGQGGIDHRCDLFSLGCVLYHLSTGQEPFRGEDIMATLMALALEEPPPIRDCNPDVPAGLADLVTKLMAKNPDQRPESAAAVSRALAIIQRSMPSPRGSACTEKELVRKSTKAGEPNGNGPTPLAGPTFSPPGDRQSPGFHSDRFETGEGKSASRITPAYARQRPETPPENAPVSPAQPEAAAQVAAAEGLLLSTLDNTGPDTLDAQVDSLLGPCPRCGTPRTSAAAKGWCLSCGYLPEKEEAPAPVVPKSDRVPKWCWYLLAGMLVIVVISVLGDLTLAKRSAARAWWGTSQLGLGVLVVIIADIFAFLFVLPTGTQVSFVEMVFPFKMWMSAFEMLPKTRHPVCLLSWGLTIMLCAVLLVGGQLYWFSKHRPLHTSAAAASSETEEQEKEELDTAAEELAPPPETLENNEDLTGLDADSDTDMDKDSSRPFKSQYVVIGYIPAEDQGIAGIVVASRGDGKLQGVQSILFSAEQTAKAEASRVLSRLKVLADPPVEAADIKAIWVEPKQSCWIGYASIDENGTLQNPILKKWESPKKPAEPK
jgi:serine/threonine protein kinase